MSLELNPEDIETKGGKLMPVAPGYSHHFTHIRIHTSLFQGHVSIQRYYTRHMAFVYNVNVGKLLNLSENALRTVLTANSDRFPRQH
jgi:hypothetical protein